MRHRATAEVHGITIIAEWESDDADTGKTKQRLEREIAKAEKGIGVLRKKLGNPEFLARAPADVVAKDQERYAELCAAVERMRREMEGGISSS